MKASPLIHDDAEYSFSFPNEIEVVLEGCRKTRITIQPVNFIYANTDNFIQGTVSLKMKEFYDKKMLSGLILLLNLQKFIGKYW
ncbi:MAG: hypothetical protein HRT68_06475 [Flavobacteriaceae bacterium]|nr:hypothetical protein [Flavobacteriaceae bacterium]